MQQPTFFCVLYMALLKTFFVNEKQSLPREGTPLGLYLPFVFAIGTGLPVILFTYLLAFAAHRIASVYQKIQTVEKYMRYIAGVIFVLAGLYYLLIFTKLI